MKKFIVVILALVYITSSIGIMVDMHYCMNKVIGWEFGHAGSKTCEKCGMQKLDQKNKGCCNDEYKFFKSSTDQKITNTSLIIKLPTNLTLPVSFLEIPSNVFLTYIEDASIIHGPPLNHGHRVPIHIFNCVYLI